MDEELDPAEEDPPDEEEAPPEEKAVAAFPLADGRRGLRDSTAGREGIVASEI